MHTKQGVVTYDPNKAATNFHKYGISFADAELVLSDPNAKTLTDPDAEGESRFVTLGMDALGRVLVVVWTPRDRELRLISARKASKGERQHYAQGL